MNTRRNVLSILIILVIFAVCFGNTEAKNTPPPLSGTKYIGSGTFTQDYATLTAAFADVTANTLGGNLVLVLQSGYTSASETLPITAPIVNATGSYSITIYPDASGRTITGSNATAIIDLNGSKNVIIDGRVNGTGSTKSLTIENTNTGGAAIRFINDASVNTIKYCTVKGVSASTTTGVIFFSTTAGTTGNDDNTIDNCDIRDGATTPTNGIYAAGTPGKENNGNTISNCNIYNFFSAGTVSTGILISSNNTQWNIINNSLYQTATRTATAGNTHYGIQISHLAGSGFTISGNYIGGSSAQCGGSAWTMSGSFANRFVGISLLTAVTSANSVQGNTIKNFNWSTTSSSSSLPGMWCGIYLIGTNANVGTVTGNTIGSATGTGSIQCTTSGSGGMVTGITVNGTTSIANIANNTIGSITASGSTTSVSAGICGIYGVTAATLTINNNLIGSTTTANSLWANTAGTGTIGQAIYGIIHSGSSTVLTVTNNTIANLRNAYAGTGTTTFVPVVRGIYVATGTSTAVVATTSIPVITGNTIYRLDNNAPYTGPGLWSAVMGILVSASSSTAGSVAINQNTVHSLQSTATTAAVNLCGIYYSNGVTAAGYSNQIQKNIIHSLVSLSSGASLLRGIQVNFGRDLTVSNNMVRLGLDTAGNSITGNYSIFGIFDSNSTSNHYHNSVYIGGTGVTGTSSSYAFYSGTANNTRNFRNNIYVNARSNGTGTGVHYAVVVGGTGANPTGLTMSNNIYFVSGTGGKLGRYNSTDYTSLAAWQEATGNDFPSAFGNPGFVNPTGSATTGDLHLTGTTPAEAAGVDAGVPDDFDGQTRSGLTPVDIGADAGNFTALDLMAPAFTFTRFSNQSSLSNRTISVTITDVGAGIPVSGGLVPRLWFRRSAPTVTSWTSVPGTLTSGNGTNGIWSFTLNYSSGGITPAAGDTIQYYFVAQDQAGTPNIGFNTPLGAVHTSVSAQSSAPASPLAYKILPILPTSLTVGTGGTYPTLTGAGGVFATINGSELGGNTTVTILSDLTETGANELLAPGMAGYSMVIRPADASLKVISNSANLTTSMIRLNGAGNITFDGSFNGSGQYLRFVNTNTTATQCKSAIEIYGGSGNDTIKNCIIETNGGTTAAGTIAITSGVNTGIIIMNNEIRDAKGTPGTAGAQTAGITAATGTNLVRVLNNTIYNFSQSGINLVNSADSSIIQGNSLYYNLPSNTASSQTGILLNGGSKHLISGNYVGGQSPLCAGPALVFPGATFTGISLTVGNTSASTVQNNVISNLSFTTTASLNFTGIVLGGGTGAVSVTARSNTIGHATDTANIVYVTTGNGSINGISANVNTQLIIDANVIAGITHRGSVSAYAVINGIFTYGNSPNTITNNRIYNIKEYAPSTSSVVPPLNGIYYYSMQSNSVISQNTIYNLHNLTSGSGNNNVAGIFMQLGSGVLSRNRIYNLQSSGAGGPDIMGIYVWDATAWSYVNNQISISNGTNSNAARIIGIKDTTTLNNKFYYNSIYISGANGSSGNSYAFLKASTDTVTLRNNLFYNSRTAAAGNHYAVGNTDAALTAGWNSSASNYNLFITSDATKMGEWGSGVTQTLAQWKTSSGGDANSSFALSTTVTAARLFADATSGNLKINMNNSELSYVNNLGTPVAGVTDDYDGDIRHLTTPDIGSDEMYINPVLKLTVLVEALYSSFSNTMLPDTMKVYLRRTTSPYSIVDSSSVLLSSAGQGVYNFTKAIRDSSFYLHLSNKSAVETWSKTGVLLNTDTVNYDFTTAANKAYGDNQLLKGSRYCLYSGDVNGDGVIDFGDLIVIDNDNSSFSGGYGPSDLNNDGVVDLTDLLIADNNNANFIGRITPLTGKRVINPRPVKVLQY